MNTARAENGVTADSIVLGQSAALSGPAASLGSEMREGADAYFQHINAQGGVHGRKIKLISLDDGYEPARTVPNTQQLIEQDKVFALFGYVGTPTSYAALPIINAAKIPFFAPFTGAEGLRTPNNRLIFNVRASYFDETEQQVKWLVAKGKKKIAVFYQDDAYGKAGLTGVEQAMARRNLKVAAYGTVQRNTVDVAGAVGSITQVEPDAVILISAYKSCAAFIREALKVHPDTLFLNVSFVGSNALAAELGPDANGVIISQVVPYPWEPGMPLVVEYRKVLKQYAPRAKPTFTNMEGYVAAKTLVEGLKNAGPDLTREKLIATLEGMRAMDLGGITQSYSPESHSGSRLVQLTVIVGTGGTFLYM
jgi:ABC-type branched-subunit amino acid transport system substrate-binding protein